MLDSFATGGAEILVAGLACQQRAQGHEVTAHGLLAGGPVAAMFEQGGVAVSVHGPAGKLTRALSLARAFRRARPDIVHCHNIGPTVWGAMAARVAGVPGILCTRHGSSTRQKRKAKFWWVARLCYRVVAVSEFTRKVVAAEPGARESQLVTIYNGVEPRDARPLPDARAEAGGLALISVGRMTWEKDFPNLLRAFATARQSVPDLRLWLLGDGAGRAELEALIGELGIGPEVRLLGMRPDIGYWLAHAGVFVLSSVSEGLPVALLEAMAAGVPVLVTDAGGMPDVVHPSGGGRVVPRSRPDALAAAMIDLANRREELPALGQAGRRYYEAHFTLERMAQQYAQLYDDALREARVMG